MFKRFKNIKLKYIIIHLIVTLAYPAARAFRADKNRLMMFTDAMTVIGALLIVLGVFYGFYLRGDFDRTSYVFQRGAVRHGIMPDFETFHKNAEEKREDSFNYPLFLGIIYLAVSAVIVFGFL